MATENNGSTEETSGEEQQGQQQSTTPETGGNGSTEQTGTTEEPTKLPDDHPLVKSLAAYKGTIATQKTELAEARAQAKRTTQLEEELNARPTQEAVDTLQTRYDRLEAFLQAAGGTIGKALDSRTFTRELFETDKDIATIVKDWNKANPTATSSALGSGAAAPADGKVNPNDLLRAAIKR
jgi:hypothetical protein